MDHETRIAEQDHDALRLWLRLLACTNVIESAIRRKLRAEFACTLPRFDLMAQLAREPEGLRMGDLSRRMMVTGANVTGIVDLLASDKLISRLEVPGDRRAVRIRLTPKGRREFGRMARVHEGWVESIMSGLNAEQRSTLYALLATLKQTAKENP